LFDLKSLEHNWRFKSFCLADFEALSLGEFARWRREGLFRSILGDGVALNPQAGDLTEILTTNSLGETISLGTSE
jgi:hypothetical protein